MTGVTATGASGAGLPPGWHTDLAVLRHGGSMIEDRGDHLVIRTPRNPGYHWGNLILVTDPTECGDARRWVSTFDAEFADAGHLAIGLAAMPAEEPWRELGLEVETDVVLSTRAVPQQRPLDPAYSARELAGADWEQSLDLAVRSNVLTGEYPSEDTLAFMRTDTETRKDLVARGLAAFFGAFHDGLLVADLGIVLCDGIARYQNVGTDAEHRRRGLAGHLLGVAARWAGDRGCDQWVIITEATNPAGRLYRSVGFEPDIGNVQVYQARRNSAER